MKIPVEVLREFISGNYSYADVGRILGVPKSTVWGWLAPYRELHKHVRPSDGIRRYQARRADLFFQERKELLANITELCAEV